MVVALSDMLTLVDKPAHEISSKLLQLTSEMLAPPTIFKIINNMKGEEKKLLGQNP